MIEVLVLTTTIVIAVWATGAQRHRRLAASRALDRYAQSRGLRFVPPPPATPAASPRVLGEKDGVAFEVDLYRLGQELRTRVSVAVASGRGPSISLARRGAFSWSARPDGDLASGDAAFDALYLITEASSEDVQALEAVLAPLVVLADREGVWLRSDGEKVSVSWCGVESDPVFLDAARDCAVTVSGWHRAPSPYR